MKKWIVLAALASLVLLATTSASADQGRRLAGPFCIGKASLPNLEGTLRGFLKQGKTTQRFAILRAGAVRSVAKSQPCRPWEVRRNGLALPKVPGPAGPAGKNGVNGTNGTNGAAGAKGDKGDAGAAGGTGSAGASIKGDTGATGAKGDKGDTVVGAPGEKGEKGDQGLPGLPGLGDHSATLCISEGNNVKYGGPDGELCDPGHDKILRVVIVGEAP